MTTTANNPTVHIAAQLIESHGVPSGDCMHGLNALFSTEISGDSQQLERLLIVASELLCQASMLLNDPNRPRQELTFGITMLQCAVYSSREIANALGVDHE